MIKKSYRRKPKGIVDGDTFELYKPIMGKKFVRLSDINTPEKGQRGYKKAKNQLRDIIGDKTITIRPKAVRRRLIAEVIANRKSVNKRMKRKGY